MYVAAIVHPEHREVIPFFPEMITRQDGSAKNDCERNAARRFYEALRREHPHLKTIVIIEDALSSNVPHIQDLIRLDLRFILGVKPGDHQFLFDLVDEAVHQEKVNKFKIYRCRGPGEAPLLSLCQSGAAQSVPSGPANKLH